MRKRPTIIMKQDGNKRKAVIQKSEDSFTSNEEMSTRGVKLGSVGYTGLNVIQDHVYEESRQDLRWPHSITTYKRMAADPSIRAGLNVVDVMINRVEWKFKTRDDASEQAKQAAEFLNFCRDNMNGMSWREFINEVGSYRQFGYHLAEKMYTRVKQGKWVGKLKWDRLETRSQDTVGKWKFNSKGRLTHAIQDLTRLSNSTFLDTPQSLIEIPRNKFLLFRWDTKKDNPEGKSPLHGAYIPWKEKRLVEEYEVIGVAKDLGGVPVIGVPVEYMNKAEANPNGPEAKVLKSMEKSAANLHAGEQTFILLPIAYDDKGKELFSFNLIGIDGGGKQYSTDDIIRRKQNEILTVFLADILKLGQEGHGSFALSDNKNNLLSMGIEAHLQLIKEVINSDLVPQTLSLNGWFFESEDMPFIDFGDLDDRDLAILGQYIQRCVAVGAISTGKALDAELRKVAKLPAPTFAEDDVIPEEFKSGTQQRSGDGLAAGGMNGTSSGASDDDTSSANLSNK